jgi:hypothetical protein
LRFFEISQITYDFKNFTGFHEILYIGFPRILLVSKFRNFFGFIDFPISIVPLRFPRIYPDFLNSF